MKKILIKIRHLIMTAASFSLFGFWGAWLAWIDLARIEKRTPGSPQEKALACRKRVSWSFRILFRFMCWAGLFQLTEIPKEEDLPKDGRFILIANHPSLIDMVALFACFPQVVIVAANYMFSNPILGPLLRRCRFIDGGDGSPFAGASTMSAGIERLESGTPVLIFPEGTRSPIRGFGTFRRGAFEMATRSGVPIIPAFITTTPRTLMKGMRWFRIPPELVKVRISLGEPIAPLPDESARAMMKRVQDMYERHLDGVGFIRFPRDEKKELTASDGTPESLPAAPQEGIAVSAADSQSSDGATAPLQNQETVQTQEDASGNGEGSPTGPASPAS